MTGKGNKKVTTQDHDRKGLMKTPKNAASDTVIKTRRGAKADARARTEWKQNARPGRPVKVLANRTTNATSKHDDAPKQSVTQTATPDPDIPTFVPSFAALAGVLNVNRAWLNDLRHRDKRFPSLTPRGWSVFAAAHFMHLRELEKRTDEDFAADHRARARETIAELDAGEWDHFGAAFVKRFRDVEEAVAAGRFDYGDGRTGRKVAIAECLDAIRDAQVA